MTATERLRKLLDERGVEYQEETAAYGTLFTVFTSKEEYYFVLVRENGGGIEIWSQYLTPEQAIAATLGAGTCSETMIDSHFRGCGECGYTWEHMYAVGNRTKPNYCPNCGAKVRGDAE